MQQHVTHINRGRGSPSGFPSHTTVNAPNHRFSNEYKRTVYAFLWHYCESSLGLSEAQPGMERTNRHIRRLEQQRGNFAFVGSSVPMASRIVDRTNCQSAVNFICACTVSQVATHGPFHGHRAEITVCPCFSGVHFTLDCTACGPVDGDLFRYVQDRVHAHRKHGPVAPPPTGGGLDDLSDSVLAVLDDAIAKTSRAPNWRASIAATVQAKDNDQVTPEQGETSTLKTAASAIEVVGEVTTLDPEVAGASSDQTTRAQLATDAKIEDISSATEKWFVLEQVSLTGEPRLVKTWLIPKDLYKAGDVGPLNPLKGYALADLDVTIGVTTNAGTLTAGIIMFAALYDAEDVASNCEAIANAVTRPHVIIDLSKRNTAVIEMPFVFRRPFMRITSADTHSAGTRTSVYARLQCFVLSEPKDVKAASATVTATVSFKMNAQVTGDTKPSKLEGFLGDIADVGTNAAQTIRSVERLYTQAGPSYNQDKPLDPRLTATTPVAVGNFSNINGVTIGNSMRSNAYMLTPFGHVPDYRNSIVDVKQLAQIDGLRARITWKSTQTTLTELFRDYVDPSSRTNKSQSVYGATLGYFEGTPTPLQYITSMYTFWSGSIKLRFYVAATDYHTGAITVSTAFVRFSDSAGWIDLQSAYSRTYEIGENREFVYEIPYIYDTTARRSRAAPVWAAGMDSDKKPKDAQARKWTGAILHTPDAIVRVVVNTPLRAQDTYGTQAEILVYESAGTDFEVFQVHQANCVPVVNPVIKTNKDVDQFPLDYLGGDDDTTTNEAAPAATAATAGATSKTGRGKRSTIAERVVNFVNTNSVTEQLPIIVNKITPGADRFGYPTVQGDVVRSKRSFASLDQDTDIKALLRRPILLFDSTRINNDAFGYAIPIAMPSPEWQSAEARNDKWDVIRVNTNPLLPSHPSVAIMSCYHHYRGSLNYTIIVHDSQANPVYVTHVPQSGTRLFGNQYWMKQTHKTIPSNVTGSRQVHTTGNNLAIIIPSVNPVYTVNVPFSSESDYLLYREQEPGRNYAWRDKADFVGGHLYLSSNVSRDVTVFVSAGDDFQYGNFVGIPYSANCATYFNVSDGHGSLARTEALDMSQMFDDVKPYLPWALAAVVTVSVAFNRKAITNAVLAPIRTPQRINGALDALTDTLREAQTGIRHACDLAARPGQIQIGPTLQGAPGSYASIADLVAGVSDQIAGAISAAGALRRFLTTCIVDAVGLLITGVNKTSLLVYVVKAVVMALSEFGLEHMNLAALWTRLTGPAVQADENPIELVMGLAAAAIGTFYNATRSYTFQTGRIGLLTTLLDTAASSKGVAYVNGVLNLFKKIFGLLRDAYHWTIGHIDPAERAHKLLMEQRPDFAKFAADAIDIMNPANVRDRCNPHYRQKYWRVLAQAVHYKKILSVIENTSNIPPRFAALITDVLRFATENNQQMVNAPVGIETFVLGLEGATNIGKSYLVSDLASAMAEATGITHPSGLVYTRNPAMNFWNGYNGQPMVVYDDWLNIKTEQACSTSISELFEMKTPQPFTPNFAHLEKKDYTAQIACAMLCSNNLFPTNINVITTTPEAYSRRIDNAWVVRKDEEYAHVNIRDIPGDVLARFGHLRFARIPRLDNGAYGTAEERNADLEFISYEDFKRILCREFRVYFAQERVKMNERYRRVMQIPDGESVDIDPMAQLYLNMEREFNPTGYAHSTFESVVARVEQLQRDMRDAREHAELELDDSTVQDDGISLCGIAGAIACGFLVTTDALSTLLKYSEKALSWIEAKAMASVQARHAHITRTCVICTEERELAYVCTSAHSARSLDAGSLHFVCASCHEAGAQHNLDRCPVCRNQTIPFISTALAVDVSRMLKTLLKTTNCCRKVTTGLLQYISGPIGHYYSVSMCSLMFSLSAIHFMAGGLCLNAIHAAVLGYAHGRGVLQGKHICACKDPGGTHPTQEDCTRFQDSVLAEAEQIPDLETLAIQSAGCSVPPGFVMPRFAFDHTEYERLSAARMPAHRSTAYGCEHVNFLRDPTGYKVVAVDGAQQVLTNGTEDVSATACSPVCRMLDPDSAEPAYQAWLTANSNRLRRHAHTLRSDPQHDSVHLRHFPEFFRPEYMQVIAEIQEPTLWQRVKESLRQNWEAIEYVGKVILGLTAIATAVFASWHLGKAILHFFTGAPVAISGAAEGSVASSASLDDRVVPKTARRVRRTQRVFGEVQASTEEDEVRRLAKLENNFVLIDVERDGNHRARMLAFGLCGSCALLPKHYVTRLLSADASGLNIFLTRLHPRLKARVAYKPTMLDFLCDVKSDLALWRVPASLDRFKDVTSEMSRYDEFNEETGPEATLLVGPLTLTEGHCTARRTTIIGHTPSMQVSDPVSPMSTMALADVIKYDISLPGACGSILLAQRGERPIIGMHVAGNQAYGEGYATAIYQELFEGKLGAFREHADVRGTVQGTSPFEPGLVLDYIGTLPPVFQPSTTTIKATPLVGFLDWPVEKRPAVQWTNDREYRIAGCVKDPLIAGAEKHGKTTVDFPSNWIADAAAAYSTIILDRMPPARASPSRLTVSQAIVGVPGVEYMDPIKLTTSAGYPWCLEPGKKAKQHYVEVKRDKDLHPISAALKEPVLGALLDEQSKRRRGIAPATIAIDTKKDETRPRDKTLKEGGTRIICNVPLQFIIAQRQNLLDFCAAFIKHRFRAWHAVGINRFGREWSQLAMAMLARGQGNIVTIDYSNFGPAFNACVAKAAYAIINEWTLRNVKGVDPIELEALAMECTASLHIAGPHVYRQYAGSPSGTPLTSVHNSVVNILYILVAWAQLSTPLLATSGFDIYRAFVQHVTLVVYGDDCIMSVSDDAIAHFNGKTITDFFARYGIAATDASKSVIVKAREDLFACEFLKSGFAHHPSRPGEFLCPVDRRLLNSIVQWGRPKGRAWQQVMDLNLRSALWFAHSLGPVGFAEFRADVNEAVRKANEQWPSLALLPITMTWESIDRMIFDPSFSEQILQQTNQFFSV